MNQFFHWQRKPFRVQYLRITFTSKIALHLLTLKIYKSRFSSEGVYYFQFQYTNTIYLLPANTYISQIITLPTVTQGTGYGKRESDVRKQSQDNLRNRFSVTGATSRFELLSRWSPVLDFPRISMCCVKKSVFTSWLDLLLT